MVREASCSCGQLRAVVEGDPIRVSVCHCLACQRRTGSVFGVQARFEESQVRIEGRSTEYLRLSDDEAEERRMNFCPDCGSTVYYTVAGLNGIAIPVGAFADPDFPHPVRAIYQSRRHGWVTLPESVAVED